MPARATTSVERRKWRTFKKRVGGSKTVELPKKKDSRQAMTGVGRKVEQEYIHSRLPRYRFTTVLTTVKWGGGMGWGVNRSARGYQPDSSSN